MENRLAVFLLPRALDGFILEDFVRPLADSPDVVVVEPGRLPAGALMRLPRQLANLISRSKARSLKLPGEPAAFVIMHPVLWPLASALLDRYPSAELWYGIWDRYDHAPDADPATRERVAALHRATSERADWRFAVSGALAAIESESGRPTDVLPPPHDSFPCPDPTKSVVAAVMGQLGRRTNWALLNSLVEEMPNLTLLLIGQIYADETPDDPALTSVLAAPNTVALGRLPDEAAARVIAVADVCLLPFKKDEFNDAGLPQRILKAARVGRMTLVPPLSGVMTEERAVKVCSTDQEWIAELQSIAALANHAGSTELRAWAISQNEDLLLAPLRTRLEKLGVNASLR
ncbi:MAG: hypothetical protein NT122_02860 [Solirubrobacterales bacterium]|nr:hypothetical protein [Solirubrobacterales bacterium]